MSFDSLPLDIHGNLGTMRAKKAAVLQEGEILPESAMQHLVWTSTLMGITSLAWFYLFFLKAAFLKAWDLGHHDAAEHRWFWSGAGDLRSTTITIMTVTSY